MAREASILADRLLLELNKVGSAQVFAPGNTGILPPRLDPSARQ
jgi:hypothetical protein